MKYSQHKPYVSSSTGINYGIHLTRDMYLKQIWKQKAYRLILGVVTISLTVSIVVFASIGLLIRTFS